MKKYKQLKKSRKIDILMKLQCKIDNLMWVVLKSEHVKKKKKRFLF